MVTVIDSIMGSGKSTYVIKMMQDNPDKRFLYVTPLLSETDRVVNAVEGFYGITTEMTKEFKKTKKEILNDFLFEGCSVAITHTLFESLNEDTARLIGKMGYVLIIDETVNCMSTIKLSAGDVRILYENNAIKETPCDNGALRLEWNDDNTIDDTYMMKAKREFNNHKEVYKGEDNNILAWSLPPMIYSTVKDVFILTYNFEGCDMSCYLKFHRVHYEMFTLKNGYLVPLQSVENGAAFRHLINVERHQSINSIGSPLGGNSKPLSKSWYTHKNRETAKERANKVKNCTYNFFNNIHKSPSRNNMVTTFCDDEIYAELARQRGRTHVENEYKVGYEIKSRILKAPFKTVGKVSSDIKKGSDEWKRKQCFVACNTRGTNLYSDRTHCAFLIDCYMPPSVNHFLHQFDIEIDEDLYALNTLVQWVWRSAIRNGNEIHLYVPSKRMRHLLLKWLGYSDNELF